MNLDGCHPASIDAVHTGARRVSTRPRAESVTLRAKHI
jgi:hypothetical protein